jgi:nucleotide-binding universal stress UspA family protein
MVKVKNILCPVDFSEISPKVAAYSQSLSGVLGADVHVVYVVPGFDHYGTLTRLVFGKSMLSEIVNGAEKAMATFIRDNFSIKNVTARVLQGYVPEEILKYAEKEDIDLIIMGTHGRMGVDRIVFGSVAEKVVKTSKIPVVTIRPD